jgi:hypothetical protein
MADHLAGVNKITAVTSFPIFQASCTNPLEAKKLQKSAIIVELCRFFKRHAVTPFQKIIYAIVLRYADFSSVMP